MDKKDNKKGVELDESVGLDGEKYYKCRFCGAVGNWKLFIKERMCCLEKSKCKKSTK